MRKYLTIGFMTSMVVSLLLFTYFIEIEKRFSVDANITIDAGNFTEQINGWEDEEKNIFFFLPSYAEMEMIELYIDADQNVTVNGFHMENRMTCKAFELETPYTIYGTIKGRPFTKTIFFLKTKYVPALYIDTESGSMENVHAKKGNQEKGILRLYNSEGESQYQGILKEIAGRGNSSWNEAEKKPYRITLDEKANLLNMGKAEKWILLANDADPTHMKNKIIYDLADEAGLYFSPEAQWVDLYLNGEYAGLYLLCERNEVHPERVDISEMGSLLVSLEMKERLAGKEYITLESGQTLQIRHASEVSAHGVTDIRQLWQTVENAIVSPNGIDPVTGKTWLEMIDLDSWARKYVIEELSGNTDASFISQYFYLDGADPDKKIYAGPVWDYDLSMSFFAGGYFEQQYGLEANRLYEKAGYETPWFYSLYQKESFYQALVNLYKTEILPCIYDVITQKIDEYASAVRQSAKMNEKRWKKENTFEKAIKELKIYLTEKVDFLNQIWLEDSKWYTVRVNTNREQGYFYFDVREGETIANLPDLQSTEQTIFDGWFYEADHLPFEKEKGIYEDVCIYARWSGVSEQWRTRLVKLVPLFSLLTVLVILFIMDIRKNRG